MDTEIADIGAAKSRDYASGPPWLFRGSALYQLHLVKSEIARSFVPKELRLVEAFGYTLGGFFLACYEDSPAGPFDELVVISGIVWNPPTSCAWASRVLVNSEVACTHGRKEVGLPSQLATFTKKANRVLEKPTTKDRGFLGLHGIFLHPEESSLLQVTEITGPNIASLCTMSLPFSGPSSTEKWAGPKIRMSLPSFSGKTKYIPSLLKYSCQIECRMQIIKSAEIYTTVSSDTKEIPTHYIERDQSTDDDSLERCISILLSKPLVTLRFNHLKMLVHAPTLVLPPSSNGVQEP